MHLYTAKQHGLQLRNGTLISGDGQSAIQKSCLALHNPLFLEMKL